MDTFKPLTAAPSGCARHKSPASERMILRNQQRSAHLLVLEARATNRVRLTEGRGSALGVGLDEQGDQEDNGNEGSQNHGEECTKLHQQQANTTSHQPPTSAQANR